MFLFIAIECIAAVFSKKEKKTVVKSEQPESDKIDDGEESVT